MTRVTSLVAAASLAATVATGSVAMLAAPARADTIHTDCMGDSCVRTHCYDNGDCTTRSTYYDRSVLVQGNAGKYESSRYSVEVKPATRACDRDGDRCRWTRDYYVDRDGRARLFDDDPMLYP